MRLVLLSSLLLPSVLSTAFGSTSGVIISKNVWNNETDSKMSLTPGEQYRVYAVTFRDNNAYATNVVIEGSDGTQFNVAALSTAKPGTQYVLEETNILTAPITITDTNPKTGGTFFTIYFVSTTIPASPVLNAHLVNWNAADYQMHSSIAKLSSATCTILNGGTDMELSAIESTSPNSVEVKIAGYDALGPDYTVMTVSKKAAGSRVIVDGPIATLYNPGNTPTDFTLTVRLNSDWSGGWNPDIPPGASTAFLSQGWLSVNESYDTDHPHDLYPFWHGMRFQNGLESQETFVTFTPLVSNYFPPDDTCDFSCGSINGMTTPYDCAKLSGTVTVACCTSLLVNIHYGGSETGPRFMIQVDSEKANMSCYDFYHPTTTSTSTVAATTEAITEYTMSTSKATATTGTRTEATTSATNVIGYSLLLVASYSVLAIL